MLRHATLATSPQLRKAAVCTPRVYANAPFCLTSPEFQCPNGECWNAGTGTCDAAGRGGLGGGDLPPGIVPGRPFLAAKYDPTPHKMEPVFASAVAAASDWMIVL